MKRFSLYGIIFTLLLTGAEDVFSQYYVRKRLYIRTYSDETKSDMQEFELNVFGIHELATDGLDKDDVIDEHDLPPFQPPGDLHCFMFITDPDNHELYWSYKDIREVPTSYNNNFKRFELKIWNWLKFIEIEWTPISKSEIDSAFIEDRIEELEILKVDMIENEKVVFESSITRVYINVWFKPIKVGVNDLIDSEKEKICFPNPATESVNICYDKEFENAEIYDAMGRTIYKSDHKIDKIDMSAFSSGTYLLKLNLPDRRYIIYKIIKY